MAVIVFIKRHFKQELVEGGLHLLETFRENARRQPGYISGETLLSHYDRAGVTVLSRWESVDDWVNWQNSADREQNEVRIESLLDRPTMYEIYDLYRPGD